MHVRFHLCSGNFLMRGEKTWILLCILALQWAVLSKQMYSMTMLLELHGWGGAIKNKSKRYYGGAKE